VKILFYPNCRENVAGQGGGDRVQNDVFQYHAQHAGHKMERGLREAHQSHVRNGGTVVA